MIKKKCPTHGYPPGWGNDSRWWGRLDGVKMEGNEIVYTVLYPYCRCKFENRGQMTGNPSKDGYVYISTPLGYMSQHRFVWEVHNGKLDKNMVVHHINGIRCDNRIENLIALPKNKHNNNIPQPFKVECPYCKSEFSVIKQEGKDALILDK